MLDLGLEGENLDGKILMGLGVRMGLGDGGKLPREGVTYVKIRENTLR